METIDPFSLAQIIGYVALVTYIAAYAIKNENRLKLAFSVSNIFWVAHYAMIGAQTAAVTTVLVTLRNLLSLNSEDFTPRRKAVTASIFSLLIVLSGILTWDGWISLIPVGSTIGITYAMLYLKGLPLRRVFLVSDASWLIHALVVGSGGGVIYAVGSLGMNALTMTGMAKDLKKAEMARIKNLP